jgi:hypothetical protein
MIEAILTLDCQLSPEKARAKLYRDNQFILIRKNGWGSYIRVHLTDEPGVVRFVDKLIMSWDIFWALSNLYYNDDLRRRGTRHYTGPAIEMIGEVTIGSPSVPADVRINSFSDFTRYILRVASRGMSFALIGARVHLAVQYPGIDIFVPLLYNMADKMSRRYPCINKAYASAGAPAHADACTLCTLCTSCDDDIPVGCLVSIMDVPLCIQGKCIRGLISTYGNAVTICDIDNGGRLICDLNFGNPRPDIWPLWTFDIREYEDK